MQAPLPPTSPSAAPIPTIPHLSVLPHNQVPGIRMLVSCRASLGLRGTFWSLGQLRDNDP